MAKMIEFKDKGQKHLLQGIKTLAKGVKVTLGPRGRNVVIRRGIETESTKDGATVAREIVLKDPFENMGAQLIKEAALKTSERSGDGTTTSIVLAEAMVQEGLKYVFSGANPTLIKQGMDKSVNHLLQFLSSMTKKIAGKDQIKQIATLSANNDSSIGAIVTDALEKVGKEGIVTLGEAKGIETELELVEGMQFDKGYISPYFVTNAEKMTVEFENFHLLIVDHKISSAGKIVPFLEKFAENKTGSLLILAEDIEAEALSTIVVNKIKVGHSLCAVKAPGIGEDRKALLEDIAILTGAKVVSKDYGLDLETVDLQVLGRAKKASISKEKTLIIDGFGKQTEIEERKSFIKTQMEEAVDLKLQKLEERLAKLATGVAIIKLGASTEAEMKEKKFRVEDALSATKAAISEGIVVGGGVALLRAISALDTLSFSDDRDFGVSIIKHACKAPAKTIAENCGNEGSYIVEKILEKEGNEGYNGLKNYFSNLLEDGVIDPVLVTKSALRYAASISSMILTCSAMIVSKPASKD